MPAEQIVFAFRFPKYRDGQALDMSRWFQNIMGILSVKKTYAKEFDDMPGEWGAVVSAGQSTLIGCALNITNIKLFCISSVDIKT